MRGDVFRWRLTERVVDCFVPRIVDTARVANDGKRCRTAVKTSSRFTSKIHKLVPVTWQPCGKALATVALRVSLSQAPPRPDQRGVPPGAGGR